MIVVGLAIMIVSEAATLARIEPFYSWNTPICWTGFILFADAVVWRARGDSWLHSNPREFVALAMLSIPLWIVFEGFNLVIHNWFYTGLPDAFALRLFGYSWAFATIWPAIFEGAELMAVIRRAGRSGKAGGSGRTGRSTLPAPPALPGLLIAAGALMLLCPFVLPESVAPYLAAPIWLGFIFVLDPINARLGAESLLGDWRLGRADRAVNLLASGLLCGFLWEFWNYWAGAKWHYTVPIMPNVKLFEMPLPGFLGFPPFALECFAMYVFIRQVFVRLQPGAAPAPHLGRTIGL